MKKIALFCCCFMTLISCNKIQKETDSFKEHIEDKMEEVERSAREEQPEEVIPDVPLGFLVTYEGKYAARENLFANPVVAERLQQLNQFNFEALLQNYNTETPIVIIDNIVHMSGCKQHNCPANAYDFFIDLDNDNINVFYFRNNMLRIYQEKGIIELPEMFATEMERKKTNAGIGNPESIESNYTLE